MSPTRYAEIRTSTAPYWIVLTGLAVIALIGVSAAHHMDAEGHHITGMSNQIVWGLPHVFAIFLIVAASGALNLASMASVFLASGLPAAGPLFRPAVGSAADWRPGDSTTRPGSSRSLDHCDDALQFQVDFCMEHHSLLRLRHYCDRLFMADDGTPDAPLEQTCRNAGVSSGAWC